MRHDAGLIYEQVPKKAFWDFLRVDGSIHRLSYLPLPFEPLPKNITTLRVRGFSVFMSLA